MLETAPVSPTAMSYDDALLYCQFLEHDGHQDWRMATEEEYWSTSSLWGWHIDRQYLTAIDETRSVIPVRDI